MEIKILDMIQKIHTPVGDKVMCFITGLGNAGLIWICLGMVLFLIPRTRKTGVLVMMALVLDVILCNGILKHVFARVRPCDVNKTVHLLVARPGDYSFPSGHTAASFAATAALFFAGEQKLWKPALVLAVLIAFSRLYLYVHYPTDILGGALVGIFCGYVGVKGTEYFVEQKKGYLGKKVKKCQ